VNKVSPVRGEISVGAWRLTPDCTKPDGDNFCAATSVYLLPIAVARGRLLSGGLALSPAKESKGNDWASLPTTKIPPSVRSCSLFSCQQSPQLLARLAETRGSSELETPPVD
jgi:hypothetical protein